MSLNPELVRKVIQMENSQGRDVGSLHIANGLVIAKESYGHLDESHYNFQGESVGGKYVEDAD